MIELDPSLWKFMRMYPSNFPSIRLSQFASLIYKTPKLFNSIIESESHQAIKELLNISCSFYWNTHFNLDIVSKKDSLKKIGSKTQDVILINAIVPLVFVYGESIQKQGLMDRSLQFLEKTEAEDNSCMKKWRNYNIKSENAFESQALLQLYNDYCKLKKCLNCTIGNHLIKSINNDY